MSRTDGGAFDGRLVVRTGYDLCAKRYASQRSESAPTFLRELTTKLDPGAEILDVGCGSGIPIARALSETYSVTGLDLSQSQIELARQNVPSAKFVHGDVLDVMLPAASFDAAVMIYSLFHIRRDLHADVLMRLRKWLRPRGYLLLTLASDSEPGYLERDFHGVEMYWSHFSVAEMGAVIEGAGFRYVWTGVIGHGYQDRSLKEERHPVVLARAEP